jgi:hypothetical protein
VQHASPLQLRDLVVLAAAVAPGDLVRQEPARRDFGLAELDVSTSCFVNRDL